MGNYVPEAMKNKNNWVLWKLENGKKIPYSANYDGKASSTNKNSWSEYEAALLKYNNSDEYNGLGFVFSEGCELVFIDIDNCINEAGDLDETARELVEIFADSYIEYSQSGRGLHIVCKGFIAAAYKGAEIEIYNKGRYMAFTGDCYTMNEPQPAQEQLNELCKRFKISKTEKGVQPEREKITQSDIEIIRKAQSGRNGQAFNDLFNGKWEDKYESQSAADMRLIGILWYYSRNAEQVARIFRLSELGKREKANRADYIARTIEAARRNTKAAPAGTREKNKPFKRKFK